MGCTVKKNVPTASFKYFHFLFERQPGAYPVHVHSLNCAPGWEDMPGGPRFRCLMSRLPDPKTCSWSLLEADFALHPFFTRK